LKVRYYKKSCKGFGDRSLTSKPKFLFALFLKSMLTAEIREGLFFWNVATIIIFYRFDFDLIGKKKMAKS